MGCGNAKGVVPIAEHPFSSQGTISGVRVTRDTKVTQEEPLVLEFTPPVQLEPYRVEEHFWPHKKELIQDYGRMLELDQHALQVS